MGFPSLFQTKKKHVKNCRVEIGLKGRREKTLELMYKENLTRSIIKKMSSLTIGCASFQGNTEQQNILLGRRNVWVLSFKNVFCN